MSGAIETSGRRSEHEAAPRAPASAGASAGVEPARRTGETGPRSGAVGSAPVGSATHPGRAGGAGERRAGRSERIGEALTSPHAVAAYAAVVGATVVVQRLGGSPLALVGMLCFVPFLAEWGAFEPAPRRPLWWVSQLLAAAVLFLSVGVARSIEAHFGAFAVGATSLLAPLWPVLVPRWLMLAPYAVAETASAHAYGAAALLTPVYGYALHRLRLRGFEQRRRRLLAVRNRIGAAIRTARVVPDGAPREEQAGGEADASRAAETRGGIA